MAVKYSVLDLATHICSSFDEPIEQLKLEKLCYYAQAWHYSFYKEKLIDEDFFAGATGPMLMPLRDGSLVQGSSALQFYGSNNERVGLNPAYIGTGSESSHCKKRNLVEAVCKWYGTFSGDMLSRLTHSEYPWQKASSIAVISNMDIAISHKDMRAFYNREHTLYSLICSPIETYRIMKLKSTDEGGITIKILAGTAEENYRKVFSVRPPLIGLNKGVDAKGASFEYFRVDNDILIICPGAKENIVERMMGVSRLKELVHKGAISYRWQVCDDEVGGSSYLYTSPELGIMVSRETLDGAIKDAVENLEHQYSFYDHDQYAPQDKEARELVRLAYAVYKSSPSDFYFLLGLNSKCLQQQGDVLNASYLV
ncbi:MAG: DUF4065 domain-containing protein [Defluviitaleaceae bacterium]|nr:DUF4065 domain-containing protein [Defluviitaleaceae bacterium]